jgi:hypothetical protein
MFALHAPFACRREHDQALSHRRLASESLPVMKPSLRLIRFELGRFPGGYFSNPISAIRRRILEEAQESEQALACKRPPHREAPSLPRGNYETSGKGYLIAKIAGERQAVGLIGVQIRDFRSVLAPDPGVLDSMPKSQAHAGLAA